MSAPAPATDGDLTADLRSDTLTRPTAAMREAMASAPVGDDVYGEDPTVLALQRTVADLLGHEDALFTPTGSMANQLGVRLHVAPGQELISDDLAHVLRAEMGAAAVLSGITSRSWPAVNGLLDVDAAMALAVTDGGAYQVGTACSWSRTRTTSVAAPSSRWRRCRSCTPVPTTGGLRSTWTGPAYGTHTSPPGCR